MRMKIILVLAAVILAAGCMLEDGSVRRLQDVEIREYQGERLDSIGDFRENSIKGVQDVDIGDYRLEVVGLVDNPLSYTYDEVISFQKYSKVVWMYCVEGWDVNILWEGILVKDVIENAGVKPEANTIIFHAVDGYTTSLPLDYVVDNDIIIAYKMNNVTLPPANGFPFQLVAEDKLGYKWIRWLNRIELSDNPSYRGFWESRGYSNTANVDGPIFE